MEPDQPAAETTRRRVAVLAPMPSELRPLIPRLGLARSGPRGPLPFRGAAGRSEVVAALTGIGMEAGATAARRILDETDFDHLVVVGIAGAIGGSVEVGDLVVPETVANRETGEAFRPVPIGGHAPRGVLVSSDAFGTSLVEARRLAERGVVAVDMETAAIASVCEQRGCPWSVFRAISDRADDGSIDRAVLALVGSDGRPNLAAVARFVLRRPGRISHLVRLARGARIATRVAADAASAALASL